MKKCFAWAALLPAVMLMSFTACQKEFETPASVSIKADASFSAAGEAAVTVSLSAASTKNVTVTLAVSTEAQSGYTAVSAADLSFNSTVTLPVGSTSASVKVSTDISKLDKDNQAVIIIASADGATIDKNAATAYISVPDTEGIPSSKLFELDWTVKYNGLQWIDGWYSLGQRESFTVTDTDGSYYYPVIVNFDEEGSIIAAIQSNPDEVIATIQEEVTSSLKKEMELWGETLEVAMYWVLYNEDNDSPDIDLKGRPAGKYEFAVFAVDDEGIVTGGYKAISFNQQDDPLAFYPYVDQAKLNANWSAAFDEWRFGGESFWITGKAPGAKYVFCKWFTDDEIEEYFGSITDMLNTYGANFQDMLYEGDSMEEIGLAEVDANGNFEFVLYTDQEEGPFPTYIIGFDADGKVLSDYGFCEVETEEPVPIEWEEQTSWVVNYDPAHPEGVTASVCDADYYIIQTYHPGYWADDATLEDIAENALYLVNMFGLSECLEYGYAFDSVPGIYLFDDAYYGARNGYIIYMFGIDERGNPTGKYHTEILAGREEIPLVERTDWAANYDARVDTGDDDYPYAVVVTKCDAKYFDVSVYNAGIVDKYGIETVIDRIGEWSEALEYYGITMADLAEYGAVGTPDTLPFVTPYDDLKNGMDLILLGYDETGAFTGEWHYEVLEGMEETKSVAPSNAPAKKVNGKFVKTSVKKATTTSFNGKPAKKNASAVKKQHTYQYNENAKLFQQGKNLAAKADSAKQHKGQKIVKK